MAQSMSGTANTPITGAEIVIRALVDQGVDTLFGYPGGAVLPIYDALFQDHRLTMCWCAMSRAQPRG